MQPRRRREASTQSEWPQLSLLAVYRETPVLSEADKGARLDDAALEAAKVLCLVSPGSDEALEGARRGRVMGTVMGVAAFARTLGPEGQEAARAVHSSKRRMLWCEVEPGYFVHATIGLPRASRHSRRASAATTSSSASASASPCSLDDDVLLADLRHAYREYRLRHGSFVATLEEAGREQLKERLDEFWRDWAERWDVSGERGPTPLERVLDALPKCTLLASSTAPQLLPLLTQFAASNPSTLPILLHDSTVLSLPDLSSSSRASPRADHAPPPPLADEDLLALVRYLHRLLPPRRSLAVHAGSGGAAQVHQSATSTSTTTDDATSSWTTPFSSLASGMTSFLAPRPMSFALSSSASSSHPPSPAGDASTAPPRDVKDARGKSLRAGFAALRRAEKDVVAERHGAEESSSAGTVEEKRAGGAGGAASAGWSLRSVSGSWSRLGFGAGAAAPASVAKAQAEASAQDDAVGGEEGARDEATLEPQPAEGDAPRPLSAAARGDADDASSGGDDERRSQPTTPLVELAPLVDVGELAEAIGASPAEERSEAAALATVAAARSTPQDDGVDEEAQTVERERTSELVCGGEGGEEGEVNFHLRRYERGALTLGLAMMPKTDNAALAWLDSRAERLLEAVESLLEVVQAPVPAYPQRHFVQRGLFVSAFSPNTTSSSVDPSTAAVAAGDRPSSSTDEELATTAALLDAYRSLRSPTVPVLESLTRLATPSAPWIAHRRTDIDPASSSLMSPSGSAGQATTASSATDVYAVLCGPSSGARGKGKGGEAATGKKIGSAGGAAAGAGAEMSLVEAADEVRRLVGASGARA